MWKRCEVDGKKYLIKHTMNESHKLYVTDLIYLWYEEIREDNLLQRCKEMNKLLEASDEVLLNLVWSLTEGEGDDVVIWFTDNDSGKQLNLQSNLDGLKFKIKFELVQADHIQFFNEVSCPLLTTISELEKRQNLLINLIKKKDLEIAEYKLEGAKISRKAVETEVFDSQSFSVKCAEGMGTTKGLVLYRPSQTLTPLVSQLLDDIASAPAITPREDHDMSKTNNIKMKNKGAVKLKSSTKAKKSKLYDDDDDDDDDDEAEVYNQNRLKNVNGRTVVGNFVQQKEKVLPSKGSTKVNKVLSNL